MFGIDAEAIENLGKQFERIVIAQEQQSTAAQVQAVATSRLADAAERQAVALERIADGLALVSAPIEEDNGVPAGISAIRTVRF